MDKENTFTVIDNDGKEVTCEVLFTFESDETKKNYIVYTDNSLDNEGNVKVYASIFEPDKDTTELMPIETDREWKIIETILESIQEETKRIKKNKTNSLFLLGGKMRIFRNVALAILIMTTAIIIFVCSYYNYQIGPVSDDNTLKTVVIEAGTAGDIAQKLKTEGLIKDVMMFKVYIKLTGNSNLKASTYELSPNMGVKKIVDILVEGNNYNPDEITIQFREGINIRDVASLISENTSNSEEDVYNLLNDKDYLDELIDTYWFITDDVKDSRIYYSLEGYLFPNTYAFTNKDVSVKEIFKKMLDEMEDELKPYKEKILASNMSVHDILTLSSIVELEGANADDRNGVAGVFANRIRDGIALGSDVTTYYGIKVNMADRDLTKKELNTCNNYNTRCSSFYGLPVGPICIPSIDSIEATLNPTEHDYYYFVADKNNKVYFTKTYNEHLNTIATLKQENLWYEY